MKTVVFIVRKPVIVTAGYYTFFCHGGIPETSEEFPKLLPVTLTSFSN